MKRKIFVFASNEAGRHGAGSALEAVKHHGALYGQGHGLQGDSYGIPTKDRTLVTLPLSRIKEYVNVFLAFANKHPEMDFTIVKIGCGLAGYKGEDEKSLALMFSDAPLNVFLPPDWMQLIAKGK